MQDSIIIIIIYCNSETRLFSIGKLRITENLDGVVKLQESCNPSCSYCKHNFHQTAWPLSANKRTYCRAEEENSRERYRSQLSTSGHESRTVSAGSTTFRSEDVFVPRRLGRSRFRTLATTPKMTSPTDQFLRWRTTWRADMEPCKIWAQGFRLTEKPPATQSHGKTMKASRELPRNRSRQWGGTTVFLQGGNCETNHPEAKQANCKLNREWYSLAKFDRLATMSCTQVSDNRLLQCRRHFLDAHKVEPEDCVETRPRAWNHATRQTGNPEQHQSFSCHVYFHSFRHTFISFEAVLVSARRLPVPFIHDCSFASHARTNYDARFVSMLPPMRSMSISSQLLPRVSHPDSYYVDPTKETNAGIWTLYAGATVFLALRLWCKITRRRGLWWDDYILVVSWVCRWFSCLVSHSIQCGLCDSYLYWLLF